jgi:hypothetical protein
MRNLFYLGTGKQQSFKEFYCLSKALYLGLFSFNIGTSDIKLESYKCVANKDGSSKVAQNVCLLALPVNDRIKLEPQNYCSSLSTKEFPK